MTPITRRKALLITIVCGICLGLLSPRTLPADPASSEAATVIGIGTADITDRNVAEARNRAIADGLTSAVNQALAGTIGPEKMSAEFQWMSQRFYDRADDFIQEYRVLAENQMEGRYRVLLSVVVPGPLLTKALSEKGLSPAVPATAGAMPKVLVCIAERLWDTEPYGYWWAPLPSGQPVVDGSVSTALTDGQFTVAAHGDPLPAALKETVGKKPEPANADAVALGRHFGADVVVVGTVRVDHPPTTAGSSIQTLQAIARMRAVGVETGKDLLAFEETAVTVDADVVTGGRKALHQVGVSAGERLAKELSGAWANPPTVAPAPAVPPVLTIHVTGIQPISAFIGFRKMLSRIPGVSEVEIRRMEKDQAEMAVTYDGEAQKMADALAWMDQKEVAMDIRVETPQSLTIALIPK